MNEMTDIGICCFCGNECNPCSQSCGYCARSYNGYIFGLNPLPANMVQYESKQETGDKHSEQGSFEIEIEDDKEFEQNCHCNVLEDNYNEVKNHILENYTIENLEKFTVKEWITIIVTWYKDNEKIVRRNDIISIVDTLCLKYVKGYDSTLVERLSKN